MASHGGGGGGGGGFRLVQEHKQRAQDTRRRRVESEQEQERAALAAQRRAAQARRDEERQRRFYRDAAPEIERPYRYAATISREAYDYQSAEYTREQVDKLMASPEYGAFRRKKCWDWVKWQTLLYLCALLAGLWIAFRFLKEDPEEEGKR